MTGIAVLVGFLGTMVFGLKWVISRWQGRQSRPEGWWTLGLSLAEPVAYVTIPVVYANLAGTIWSWTPIPLAVVALGALLVFVTSAGVHGYLLVSGKDAGEAGGRAWAALGYALVAPGVLGAGAALLWI